MKINTLSVVSVLMGTIAFSAFADEALVTGPGGARGYGATKAPVAQALTVITPQAVAVQPVREAAAPEAVPEKLNLSRLTFMDSKLFDMRLGKELASGKDVVVVDISGHVPLSNIPARIDNWVVRSAEEGKVELLPSEAAPKTRFLFSLVPMLFSAYGSFKHMQEENMFDKAKEYDTKIYFKKDDLGETLIEKIVLTRRKKN